MVRAIPVITIDESTGNVFLYGSNGAGPGNTGSRKRPGSQPVRFDLICKKNIFYS